MVIKWFHGIKWLIYLSPAEPIFSEDCSYDTSSSGGACDGISLQHNMRTRHQIFGGSSSMAHQKSGGSSSQDDVGSLVG